MFEPLFTLLSFVENTFAKVHLNICLLWVRATYPNKHVEEVVNTVKSKSDIFIKLLILQLELMHTHTHIHRGTQTALEPADRFYKDAKRMIHLWYLAMIFKVSYGGTLLVCNALNGFDPLMIKEALKQLIKKRYVYIYLYLYPQWSDASVRIHTFHILCFI